MSTDHQNISPSSDDGEESLSTASKKKAGRKGNSGSSRKMTAKEQSERFIETARQLESDETDAKFESLINKIAQK